MKKNKLLLRTVQVIILSAFSFFMVKCTPEDVDAGVKLVQMLNCSYNGLTYIGDVDDQHECIDWCLYFGYREAYCTAGYDPMACYCK